MANTIKIKRKPLTNGAGVPSNLSAGELAFSEADAKLFYGLDSGGSITPIEIAGSGYVTSKIATAISGVSVTAGSGLGGGGSLNTTGVTINVGAGEGISVDANTVGVDTTVIRTSGAQTISNGIKTFTSTSNGAQTFLSDDVALKVKLFSGSGPSDAAFVLENDTDPGTTTTFRINKNGTITYGIWGGSTIDVNKGGTGATSFTSGNLLVGNNTSAITAPYSVASSITTSSTAIPTAAAVKTYADGLLGTNDAMVYKGTIGSVGSGATYVTNLPTTYSAGWTIRVITAETYAGKVCEVGDLLIATVDRSGTGNDNSDWTVVQTNIDGAVIGPASSTSGNFPIFNNDTGKLIANSSYGPSSFYSASNPSSYTPNAVPLAGGTMTGALGIPLGSTGSPSIFFSGDTNTGFYSSGADTIDLVTGGNRRLIIASDGDVGIGNTSPSTKLDVSGVIKATGGNSTLWNEVSPIKTGLNLRVVRGVIASSFSSLGIAVSYTTNTIEKTSVGAFPTIDGISYAVGDRILVAGESGATGARNGIYAVSSLGSAGSPWILTRSTDADSSSEIKYGMIVVATEGTTYANTSWVLTTTTTITIGTTAITFTQGGGFPKIWSGATGFIKADGSVDTTVYTTNTGTVTSVSAGNGLNFTTITGSGSVTLGTPSSITTTSSNGLTANSHTHAFAPGGTTSEYIRGDGSLATLCSGIADCTIDGGTFS